MVIELAANFNFADADMATSGFGLSASLPPPKIGVERMD
jgi:hypothetical protein